MKKILSLTCVLLISCNTTEIIPGLERGLQYYPMQLNDSTIYDITRISYQPSGNNDTSFYQLLEVFSDTFTNLAGDINYRVEQFVRTNTQTKWTIDSVVIIQANNDYVIRKQGNVSYIKLTFPIRHNISWDGNARNTHNAELYYYNNVRLDTNFNGQTFLQTVQVIHQMKKDILNKDLRLEIFDDNVGLIYRREEIFDYISQADDPAFGMDSIVGGVFFEQQILFKN